MSEIKSVIAKNISALRVYNNMTQLELAEKLHYSDKAVSKWERGESIPDISALISISELFSVSLDDLVKSEDILKPYEKAPEKKHNLKAVKLIVDVFIWTVALFMFVLTVIINGGHIKFSWLYFVYALPIDLIVSVVLNSIWFNKRTNYYFVSGLVWSVLLAVFATFCYFNSNIRTMLLIFLLGIAGQVIIILWSFIRPKKKK